MRKFRRWDAVELKEEFPGREMEHKEGVLAGTLRQVSLIPSQVQTTSKLTGSGEKRSPQVWISLQVIGKVQDFNS